MTEARKSIIISASAVERLHVIKRISGWDIYAGDYPEDMLREELPAGWVTLVDPDASAGATFQQRVLPWMFECFGPAIPYDKLERGDRFLEEALELLQSCDYPKERAYALIEYVYGRENGEPRQEVGGTMVTLAAYCLAHDIDMHEAGETELARIWTKVEKIRAKQAAKPTGSALPVADLSPSTALPELERLREEVRTLRAALTPSAETKAAYMGEFSFRFPVFDKDGEEVTMTPNVPWTTIKEIMAAIRDRAALAGKEG